MKCRICFQDITEIEDIYDSETNLNSLYSKPVVRKYNSAKFGYCTNCAHGQLENIFVDDHYDNYNLLHVDGLAIGGGGNVPLRINYYTEVIDSMNRLAPDNEKILDIGCGQGTLMELAHNRFQNVKGVDPSKVECEIAKKKGLDVLNAYFDGSFAEKQFSAFIMTQLLEHVPDLQGVVDAAYQILKDDGIGYIDVPNGHGIYMNNRFFDVYAEHINYFSANSLVKLLSNAGFYIISVSEIFDGHHIAVYVKKKKRRSNFEEKRVAYEKEMDSIFQQYPKVSIYGAGIKGREFIKLFLNGRKVAHVFDSNVALSGLYVANCDRPIEEPTTDSVADSDVIIITAVEYKYDIIEALFRKYHYAGEIITIDRFEVK